MTLAELKVMRAVLREKLQQLDQIKPGCMSCIHFASGRTCAHFDAAPPPEWQAGTHECRQWQHDQIPF